MSPYAQRIAIAKACDPVAFERHPMDPELIADGDGGWKELPDYPADLNACHEMEESLDDTQDRQCFYFANNIEFICDRDAGGKASRFGMFHATAAQRSEAFLRTLSLWDESS